MKLPKILRYDSVVLKSEPEVGLYYEDIRPVVRWTAKCHDL